MPLSDLNLRLVYRRFQSKEERRRCDLHALSALLQCGVLCLVMSALGNYSLRRLSRP